jgi:hypothetical protein
VSRRLPIVGSKAQQTSLRAVAQDTSIITLHVDGVARIAVIDARVGAGAEDFVAVLTTGLSALGRNVEVGVVESIDARVLLVLIGADTSRPQRSPRAQALWTRADVALAASSERVAQALVASLAPSA